MSANEDSLAPLFSRLRSRSLTELTRQITPPTKNGHAPPPTESRKSSQSVNHSCVRAGQVVPCWVKLSRRLHAWWCPSVNFFKFQPCDHTPPGTPANWNLKQKSRNMIVNVILFRFEYLINFIPSLSSIFSLANSNQSVCLLSFVFSVLVPPYLKNINFHPNPSTFHSF